MINVEAEVNKHKNKRDRDQLEKLIKGYKDLALQHAANLVVAGQYSTVARKLQEICDKLPAPYLKKYPGSGAQGTSVETATITSEEKSRISDAWKKRTKS